MVSGSSDTRKQFFTTAEENYLKEEITRMYKQKS